MYSFEINTLVKGFRKGAFYLILMVERYIIDLKRISFIGRARFMASGRVHRNIYFYKVEAAKFDKKLDRETEIEDVGKLSEDIMSKIPEGTEGILNMPDGGAFLKVEIGRAHV